MSSVVVNDVFDELREENDRLLKELDLAEKRLKIFFQYRTFIERISYHFKYNLETNDRQEYEELVQSVDKVCVDLRLACFEQNQCRSQTAKTSAEKPLISLRKPFVCNLCFRGFASRKSLARHRETIHKEEVQSKNRSDQTNAELNAESNDATDCVAIGGISVIELTEEKPLSVSKKRFTAQKSLKKLKVIKSRLKDKNESFVCEYPDCGFQCRTPMGLSSHRKTHQPRPTTTFICPVATCQKQFVHQSVLKAHVSRHETSRPFKCTVNGCYKTFKTKYEVKSHIERIHGDKGHPCDWPGCDFKSATKQLLNDHKSYLHSEERNFPCEWPGCDMKFKTRNNVVQHTKIHKGEKPHQCTWPGCDYRCLTGADMRLHTSRRHSNDYKFECVWPGCSKRFKTKPNLTIHHNKVHNKDRVNIKRLKRS